MAVERIPNASSLTGWRKSTHSSPNGSCLEVLDGYRSGVPVRDSKQPGGPALVFGPAAFSVFVTAVQVGRVSA